ncbi:hypothetical protein YC2023_102163 [Brassica napus]
MQQIATSSIDNFLSNIHRDGTHQQISDLHRPQDRRLLRVCETKPKSIATSVTVMKPNEKAAVSSSNPMNPEAANALSPTRADQVMLFRDVSPGPREAGLRFRLIHF